MPSFIYKAIEYLPIRKVTKLDLTRRYIDKQFRASIKAAEKAGQTKERLEEIHQDWALDVAMIEDEQDVVFTRRLRRDAMRLRVPMPAMFDENWKMSNHWSETRFTSERVLSEVGVAKVREDLRVELRWRQEQRAHWFVLVSSLTGALGAATGLVAVWQKWGSPH